MAHLHVSVRLHDLVVDQRLCTVADEVWLGESERAEVAFPGASIRIRRFGDRLQLQGVWLDPGRPVHLRRGPVEVELEAVLPRRLPRPLEWAPDLRLLVASAAVVLFGATWDAADAFVHENASLIAGLVGDEAVRVVVGPPELVEDEPITAVAEPLTEPPAAEPLDLPDVEVQTLPPTVRWSPE